MATSPIDVSSLLSAFGLGGSSNIDVSNIVQQIMDVDSEPLTTLQQQETNVQTDISAYGTVLSSLSGLQSAVTAMQNSTTGLSATPSDSSYFTATAASGAVAGTTGIDIKNIATTQTVYSTTFGSATSAVADLSVVGTQQLQIQVGSSTAATININSGNNTLSGIAEAINSANAGVTASVLQVSSNSYELGLTSNATGSSNRITVKVDETGSNFGGGWAESGVNTDMTGLSQLAFDPTNGGSYDSSGVPTGGIQNMTQTMAAIDATMSVNGVEIQRSSNTVTDAVTGVTLNLLKGDPSYNAASPNLSLDVAASSSSLANQLNSFVTAYNSAMSTISNLYQPVPAGTQATQTNQGLLSGDIGLLTLSTDMMNSITSSYGTEQDPANNSLVYLGFSLDKNGVLSFNSSTLSNVYQTDSANITTMINNMASSFGSDLSNYITTTIPGEQSNYQTQVTNLQSQYTQLQSQLNVEQTDLISEYSSLATTVTNDNIIGNYLTTQTNLLTNPKSY